MFLPFALLIGRVAAQAFRVEIHIPFVTQQCNDLTEAALPFDIAKLKQCGLLLGIGQRLSITVFNTGYLIGNQRSITHAGQFNG